jgi:hypothetical protein
MRSITTAWAIEYPNGRLMQGVTGVELYSTKSAAQWTLDNTRTKGKPVKVRITDEKVI